MKQVLILTITFLSLTVLGQDTKPLQKILIGFNFSPDYAYRVLKNGDGSSSTDLVIKTRNDIEIAKFGYTTGLNACFNFSKRVGFETGIQFSNKGYKNIIRNLVYFPPNSSLPINSKTVYAYQYIGIPIKAKFSFGKSKVRVVSGVGFITNFLVNFRQVITYKYADGKTEKRSQSSKDGFKSVDISPLISLGIQYKLNDKMHLLTEPTFRYGLIKTKDAPVTENLWNAGLNIVFYYGLK